MKKSKSKRKIEADNKIISFIVDYDNYDILNSAYVLEVEKERQELEAHIEQDLQYRYVINQQIERGFIKPFLTLQEIATLCQISKSRVQDFYRAGCFLDTYKMECKNTILISSAEIFKIADKDFISKVQAYKKNENAKSKIKNGDKPYNSIKGYYKKKSKGQLEAKDILQKQARTHLSPYQYKAN